MSPQRPDRPPNQPSTPPGDGSTPPGNAPASQNYRWLLGVAAIGVVAILVVLGANKGTTNKTISYSKYMQDVTSKQVGTAQISNSTGAVMKRARPCLVSTRQSPSMMEVKRSDA